MTKSPKMAVLLRYAISS